MLESSFDVLLQCFILLRSHMRAGAYALNVNGLPMSEAMVASVNILSFISLSMLIITVHDAFIVTLS